MWLYHISFMGNMHMYMHCIIQLILTLTVDDTNLVDPFHEHHMSKIDNLLTLLLEPNKNFGPLLPLEFEFEFPSGSQKVESGIPYGNSVSAPVPAIT